MSPIYNSKSEAAIIITPAPATADNATPSSDNNNDKPIPSAEELQEQEEIQTLAQQEQELSEQQAQQTSLIQDKLSDPIIAGLWVSKYRLPNDNYSIDNIVMMKNSSKWPLFIDPQQQANIFIKELERERHLQIINPQGNSSQSATASSSGQQ